MMITACLLVLFSFVVPDEPKGEVSFAREIRPFLTKYCFECHNSDDADGGLAVESFEGLVKGGERGASLVPGKPDESRLVLVLEGKAKPEMPPKKAAQRPSPAEVARVRQWVLAGAKNDAAEPTPPVALPAIKPRASFGPKIVAAAYRPDNQLLAVAAGREVLLLDPAEFTVRTRLAPPPHGGEGNAESKTDPVTALAWSRNGQWLAVATGSPSQRGEVHLYAVPAPLPVAAAIKPAKSVAAHADLIHAIDFSPDGKLLATAAYDRLVKLWNASSGDQVAALKDHSDAVYDVAFSPDSRLLASGAADRAVKVWEVVSGRRLYTLGEPTDWVYAVAWSPDGKFLAAAGVDRSIRVWQATAAGNKLVHSTFAHDAPVTQLAFSHDSRTLFSLSEDRTVKAWDTAQMVERHHSERLAEAPLALAVSPDSTRLAVGRFDGVLDFLDASNGKPLREPLAVAQAKPAVKPDPPVLTALSPRGAQRGRTVSLALEGKNLHQATELAVTGAAANSLPAKFTPDAKNPSQARVELVIAPDTPPGVVRLALKSPYGNSAELPFAITPFPEFTEAGPNEAQTTAPKIPLPSTIVGTLDRAGDTDYFKFDATPGLELGIEVLTGAIGSKMEPVLRLADESGQVLAETQGSLLGFRFDKAGTFVLQVRDVDYRGSAEMFYRANLGDIPLVTEVFPLGVARGGEVDVQVQGVNLGGVKSVKVKAPESAAPGSRLDVPAVLDEKVQASHAYSAPLNGKSLVVGEFAEVAESGSNDDGASATSVPTPSTINGRIERPGDVDLYRFKATKGQSLIIDVNARRLGSPLDSLIDVLDTQGQPLPRATLRSVAKTYTVFRDHDSSGPGIRIEDWRELAINDFILIGNELLRMQALPRNPDDDARFFDLRGQRVGYLDTTPAHIPLGTPIYKVSLHPPGTVFPPNGMPVVTIFYHNDDGGPQYGKDSRLFFDPPSDGEYMVRVSDVRGQGGSQYAYRLAIRPPRPSFTASFSPTAPQVWKGGAVPISISCERTDEFEGAIRVRLENLPPGFSAPESTIPAGENSTALALSAEPGAVAPPSTAAKLKLVATANINGRDEMREVAGELPVPIDSGDIITRVEQTELTIQPGREAKLKVHVERRNDFKGRIPLEVRGLPHGTRVLDVGLNGILITERESSRIITFYSEPWAEPMTHPFVVLAKREGKNTEHAAPSILLHIVPGTPAAAAGAADQPRGGSR